MPAKKLIFTCCFLLFAIGHSLAQISPTSNVSIPMRDGQFLQGDLYLPNNTDSFSTILIQTPYNKNLYQFSGLPLGVDYDASSSPYAFLIVDWRCFFQSTAACTALPNRGEDGYDVVEWIAQQSWSNGKVGTWGPSALSVIQFQTAREKPPHLVCGVPVVTAPQTYYEKYYTGGALRIDYFDFVGTYFGLNNIILDNPYFNNLWSFAELNSTYPEDIEVPMFIIGGWFDINSNDCFNMFELLRTSSPTAVRNQHRLLIGPWSHSAIGLETQGDLMYSNAVAVDDSLARMFFDYHLENVNNSWENTSNILYYQMGDNAFYREDAWPPAEAVDTLIYLQNDLSMKFNAPSNTTNDVLTYSYDPNDPSPSIGGKFFETHFLHNNVGPIDQRDSVESRNDHVIFTSEALTADLSVQGAIKAKIYFSSDRKDTDLSLRITDVYPDGRSLIFAESHLRLRFRDGLSVADTSFMQANTVYELELTFDDIGHTFLEGHSIRLIVTSSNYPRFNRNMNTGGEMYPNYNIDTLVNPLVAANNVHVSSVYPSHLELPVNKEIDTTTTAIRTSLKDEMDIWVYPNPSSSTIVVDQLSPWQAMYLYDINGRVVWSTEQGSNESSYTIDVSGFSRGTYYLEVISNAKTVGLQKVIIH